MAMLGIGLQNDLVHFFQIFIYLGQVITQSTILVFLRGRMLIYEVDL